MELLKPKIEAIGPGAVEHNMPCSVCHKNHAVMACDTGIFRPCWSCQKLGHKIVYVDPERKSNLLKYTIYSLSFWISVFASAFIVVWISFHI